LAWDLPVNACDGAFPKVTWHDAAQSSMGLKKFRPKRANGADRSTSAILPSRRPPGSLSSKRAIVSSPLLALISIATPSTNRATSPSTIAPAMAIGREKRMRPSMRAAEGAVNNASFGTAGR